ncbi:MAG: hypothetical protein ACP5VE_15390 [Chthonomonadales bacterium]
MVRKPGLSEWKLRMRAEKELGGQISHKQFQLYRQWGLIPEPNAEGRWEEDVARRLVEIRRAEKECRSLPRRVILLRKDFTRFPVPTAIVVKAMLEITPTIVSPARKMKRIHKAVTKFSDYNALFAFVIPKRIPTGCLWRPPTQPERWIQILNEWEVRTHDGREVLWNKRLEMEREPRLAMAYHLDGVLEFFLKGQDDALHRSFVEIPFEERVTLLYIRDLSLTTRACEQAKEAASEAMVTQS